MGRLTIPLLQTGASLLQTGATLAANKASQKENREYNLKLAQMQNQWNVEQWQRANDYNSPSAQVQRLRDAGLNPNLIYGNGLSNIAVSSPEMTGGSPSSPMDWSSLANMNNPVNNYLDAQLKQAQIDNINADTGKKGAETSILTDQAAFTKAIQQGQLDLQNAQINLIGKQGNLTDQEIKESQQRCLQIEASVKEIYANIEKIGNDINISKAISEGQLRQMAAQCNLSYAQAKSIVDQLPHVIDQLKSQTANNDATANLRIEELGQLELMRDAVAFDARVKSMKSGRQDDLSVWQHVMLFLGQVMSTLGNVIH